MPTMTRIDELTDRAGTELGVSDWVAVTQDAVDAFAMVVNYGLDRLRFPANAVYRVYEER
jgi:acyl dehydratase